MLAKIFTLAAYAFFTLSMALLVFLLINVFTIGAASGRFILELAAISIFGMAILQTVKKRSVG
jgi:hypothetical protein